MTRSSPLLSVAATHLSEVVLLSFDGDIDPATHAIVAGEVNGALAKRPKILVLDLGRVGFFGAQALHALLEARQAAHASGCRFELRSLPPMALRVIDACDATELLESSDNDDDEEPTAAI